MSFLRRFLEALSALADGQTPRPGTQPARFTYWPEDVE